MKNKNTISVVIPNYNGIKLLKKYLSSVITELDDGDEIIIVDDNSTDKSISYLLDEFTVKPTQAEFNTQVSKIYFPQPSKIYCDYYTGFLVRENKRIICKVVALHKNMRFAAAVNTGVLCVSNKNFLLLNTDVKLMKGCKSALLSVKTDQTFAVGCLEYEDTLDGKKSGKNKLWFSKGMFMHSKADNMESGPTAWVSGGSGLFDTQKWIQLDGFDQLYYPAYWEDIDISFRARKKGWGVLFEATAVVIHKHESTNSNVYGSHKMLQMSWKNADSFVQKNGTWWQIFQHYLWKPYWKYKRAKFLQSKVEL